MLLKITTDKLSMKYDDKGGIVRRINFLLNFMCTNQVSLYPVTSSTQPWERLKNYQAAEIADKTFLCPISLTLLVACWIKKKKKKQSEHPTIACLIFLPYLMKK